MPTGIYIRTKPMSEKQMDNCRKMNLLPKTKKQLDTLRANGKLVCSRKGANHIGWRGGITRGRYINLYLPDHPYAHGVYVLEHRLVVEYFIGRYLLPLEIVHHVNEIKHCNHPKNLMAFVNESAHKRFERQGIVSFEEIIFDGRKLKEPINWSKPNAS